jgi:hypothetical protein
MARRLHQSRSVCTFPIAAVPHCCTMTRWLQQSCSLYTFPVAAIRPGGGQSSARRHQFQHRSAAPANYTLIGSLQWLQYSTPTQLLLTGMYGTTVHAILCWPFPGLEIGTNQGRSTVLETNCIELIHLLDLRHKRKWDIMGPLHRIKELTIEL